MLTQLNESVILQCPNQTKFSTITWYKNDKQGIKKLVSQKPQLIIPLVKYEHLGEYTCKVSTAKTNYYKIFKLKLSGIFKFDNQI